MSILCQGDTHVFQLNSPTCDCGLWGAFASQSANPSIGSGPGPYPLYYPHGPNNTTTTPPTAGEAPPVSLVAFKAAQDAGATWLSADGLRAYRDDRGNPEVAYWDESAANWGSWWGCEQVAADAVKM